MILFGAKSALVAAFFLFSAQNVLAHMSLADPFPFNSPKNPNTKNADFNLNAPLSGSGNNFPCKGAHKLLGTPEGKPVASWSSGSSQSFTIGTGATHAGGSCQASISEDGGVTFKVIKSYIGACPTESGGTFSFNVPKETKSGDHIFAWTWFNKLGQREMYMNCAPVTITDGGDGLGSYPDIFVANIGNGCTITEGTDVLFPNPGNDVEIHSDNPVAPVGSCGGGGGPAPPENSDEPSSTPSPPPPLPSKSTPAPPASQSKPPSSSTEPAAPTSTTIGETTPVCVCTCGGPNGYVVHISPMGGNPGMLMAPAKRGWFM